MTTPIKSVVYGFLVIGAISLMVNGFYIDQIILASTSKPIIPKAKCSEPQITSIQFNAEVLKFLMLDDRLNLLMPLPITGLSATIVDIRATMKKMRK